MDFDQMQVVWDSQKNHNTFVFDSKAMLKTVRRRSRRIGWGVNADEFGMILICLCVAAVQASQPLLEGTHQYKYIGAVLFIGVAAYTLRNRMRRLRHERSFDTTMLGELDRAIYRVDCQVIRSRTFLWWFMLPAAVLMLISFTQHFKPIAALFGILSFPLGYWVTRFGLRCTHLPQKRELEALHSKLSVES